jgi:hypothetical protein
LWGTARKILGSFGPSGQLPDEIDHQCDLGKIAEKQKSVDICRQTGNVSCTPFFRVCRWSKQPAACGDPAGAERAEYPLTLTGNSLFVVCYLSEILCLFFGSRAVDGRRK